MEEDIQTNEPIPLKDLPKGKKKKKEEPKEGKALKGWAKLFFILSCIMTGLIAASLALPFFLIILGVISTIAWLVVLVFFTIFTIGMIWLSDDVKAFNQGWMAFNNALFNSGSTVAEKVMMAMPIMSVIGGTIVAIAWILLITGIVTDKNRKKLYTGLMIALGILSLLYIIATIFVIIAVNG